MLWGTLWGVPGLVLAVPLTAVLRIHLAHIDHPLPRLLLRLLDGGRSRPTLPPPPPLSASRSRADGSPAESDELLPLHAEDRAPRGVSPVAHKSYEHHV